MILIKNGIERIIEDTETIRIFKEAGWEEYENTFIQLKEINEVEKEEKLLEAQEKQPTKKTNKKRK